MQSMSNRIRWLRSNSKLSQTDLAKLIGVKRSAVAQWESLAGTRPSVDHLAKLAVATNANFEWLATGRGQNTTLPTPAEVSAVAWDYAIDELESRALDLLRKMSPKMRLTASKVLEALACS